MQSGQKYRLSNDMFKFKEALVRTENRIERKRHVLHKNICPFTVLCGPCPAPVFNRIQNTELGNNNEKTQRRKEIVLCGSYIYLCQCTWYVTFDFRSQTIIREENENRNWSSKNNQSRA